MNCPACSKEITPDRHFCTWCNTFVPEPARGRRANLFARWVALTIDPLIAVTLWGVAVLVLTPLSESLAGIAALLFPLAYLIWFLRLLRSGLTPGKKLLGLRVLDQQTGDSPGFGKMFLRELVGRALSALLFGLGYIWALFDKNGQAWHDKLAGTVVVNEKRA